MPFLLKKYYPARNIFFFLGEGLLIFVAINSVYFIFKGSALYCEALSLYALRALAVTFIFQISLYFFDLYDLSAEKPVTEDFARITQAFGLGCIALGIVYFFVPVIMISTRIFWVGYAAICASIFFWRFLYSYVLDRRMFAQPIVLLGAGEMAGNIAEEIITKRDSGHRIVSIVGQPTPGTVLQNLPATIDMDKLPALCRENKVEKIVVALDDRRGQTPIRTLLRCKLDGVTIVEGITFYEGLTGKILVEKVNPSWLIYSSGFKVCRWCMFSKRLLDVVVSFTGLLLSSPITLVSALIIKLESPGPVFYTQERVGEQGRVFRVIKFRSMRSDAEKNGPVWAMKNDSRVTRFGGFIRKVRIDEIPQMWNVLKGEMSFVGPRPERPVFVEQLTASIPYYSLRHSVKPGITGWAQICYPYGASEKDALRKLEYDLYYIKNLTITMDFWIIFQTIKTVLFQKGAR
ncbi:MAG: TIGR03013 family XrtA/PEP-CTERM system glycosyltransferase [Thermodesulfobacteriota bacterium]